MLNRVIKNAIILNFPQVQQAKIGPVASTTDPFHQPTAQFAIFKFTVKNADGTANINVKPLTITIGSQDYVITSASATSELFVALPPISGEAVTFRIKGRFFDSQFH